MIFYFQLFLFVSLSFAGPLNSSRDDNLKQELHDLVSSRHISFSYNSARQKLFNEIHLKKDQDGHFIEGVYCRDKYYPFGGQAPGNRLPNHDVFNTEHTWPQSKFSPSFERNVQKTDLHHLFPTFSKINSQRGNLPFAEVNSTRRTFCEISRIGSSTINGSGNYFEPPNEHKGNVARAMFYFSIRYQSPIDTEQEHFLKLWHEADPVDSEEEERNEKIFSIQKNRNPFIDRPELVQRISDF